MDCKNPRGLVLMTVLALGFASAYAGNIDPYEDDSQYAYSENTGWLNFEPSHGPGVTVSSMEVTGYLWAENIGWINLSPVSYGSVFNDGAGNLSGYAWGENVGWINFSPEYGGVTIDIYGNFSGWAWGENIGWISFNSADLDGYNVKVCKVNFYELASFADDWLESNDGVDFTDYAILADYWLDYCPDDWLL